MEAVKLSREDFLDEIRIAPKWDLVKYYNAGFYDLLVFYPFGAWLYRSPNIFEMQESERKYFYKTLSDIVNTPSVKGDKIE